MKQESGIENQELRIRNQDFEKRYFFQPPILILHSKFLIPPRP